MKSKRIAQQNDRELTKPMVATSEAVAKNGLPANGYGTLPTTSNPLSMVKTRIFAFRPSRNFLTVTHFRRPKELAASAAFRASSSTLNFALRFDTCCASSQRNPPRVKRKNSSFLVQWTNLYAVRGWRIPILVFSLTALGLIRPLNFQGI